MTKETFDKAENLTSDIEIVGMDIKMMEKVLEHGVWRIEINAPESKHGATFRFDDDQNAVRKIVQDRLEISKRRLADIQKAFDSL